MSQLTVGSKCRVYNEYGGGYRAAIIIGEYNRSQWRVQWVGMDGMSYLPKDKCHPYDGAMIPKFIVGQRVRGNSRMRRYGTVTSVSAFSVRVDWDDDGQTPSNSVLVIRWGWNYGLTIC